MNITTTRLLLIESNAGVVVMCKDSWWSCFLNMCVRCVCVCQFYIPWLQLITTHLIIHSVINIVILSCEVAYVAHIMLDYQDKQD